MAVDHFTKLMPEIEAEYVRLGEILQSIFQVFLSAAL